jgi:hypothetical protein
MITREEILMGRDKIVPLSQEQEDNLEHLLECLNKLRTAYGKPMYVSSGYRPEAINSKVKGAAKKSNHIMCLACDFKDLDGSLDEWCLQNLDILEECGLYLESPMHTPNWCHLQAIPPKSGKRIFIP